MHITFRRVTRTVFESLLKKSKFQDELEIYAHL